MTSQDLAKKLLESLEKVNGKYFIPLLTPAGTNGEGFLFSDNKAITDGSAATEKLESSYDDFKISASVRKIKCANPLKNGETSNMEVLYFDPEKVKDNMLEFMKTGETLMRIVKAYVHSTNILLSTHKELYMPIQNTEMAIDPKFIVGPLRAAIVNGAFGTHTDITSRFNPNEQLYHTYGKISLARYQNFLKVKNTNLVDKHIIDNLLEVFKDWEPIYNATTKNLSVTAGQVSIKDIQQSVTLENQVKDIFSGIEASFKIQNISLDSLEGMFREATWCLKNINKLSEAALDLNKMDGCDSDLNVAPTIIIPQTSNLTEVKTIQSNDYIVGGSGQFNKFF